MAIDYSQLAGMNYDETSPQLTEGGVWAAKQVYGAIQNIDYGILWIADKHGLLIDNPEEVNAYSKRFTNQWKSKAILLLSGKNPNNPIYETVKYIVHKYTQKYSLDALKNLLKVSAIYGIRSTTTYYTIDNIIEKITYSALVKIAAQSSLRAAISETIGVFGGIYANYEGLQMRSFSAIQGLKIMKPKLYAYLYKNNIETFWFLIFPYVSNIIKYIN